MYFPPLLLSYFLAVDWFCVDRSVNTYFRDTAGEGALRATWKRTKRPPELRSVFTSSQYISNTVIPYTGVHLFYIRILNLYFYLMRKTNLSIVGFILLNLDMGSGVYQ